MAIKGHKRQARRQSEKRRRVRREKRGQRRGLARAAPAGPGAGWLDAGGEVACAWVTPELGFAVSGRLTMALAVRGRGGAGELVLMRSSLLARGYLGSLAAVLPGGFEKVLADFRADPVFGVDRLEAVAPEDAAWLAWGMFAWSVSRGTIDPDEFDGPCLGRLARPPGGATDWLEDFVGRVPGLVEIADDVAACPDDWGGAPADRPDRAVVVEMELESSRPLALAGEIGRSVFEFSRTGDRSVFEWSPPSRKPGALDLERPRPLGRIELVRDRVLAEVGSARGAATLALRLREIDPGLQLGSGNWRLVGDSPGELRLAR